MLKMSIRILTNKELHSGAKVEEHHETLLIYFIVFQVLKFLLNLNSNGVLNEFSYRGKF